MFNINGDLYNKKVHFFIVLSFIFISLLSCVLLLSSHSIEGTGDLPFHMQRIKELVESFKYGHFLPQFNLNAMGQNGGAALVMYPYITLIPIAILLSIFHFSIGMFYFILFCSFLCSLLIAFYSSLSYERNINTSFMFAVLYSTSSMFMNYWFNNGDMGVVLAITFLPLAIFGYLNLLKDGSWRELSLGFILMIFSHVLSPLITLVFLIILSLFYFRRFKNKAVLIGGVKAAISILTITSFVWVPAMELLHHNRNITNAFSYSVMNGTDLLSTSINGLKLSVNFTPNFTITFFAIIALFAVPFYFYRKMNPDLKKLSIATILFYVLSTNLLPWSSWSASKIAIIQFPWRLDFVPQLLLIYLFAYCVTHYMTFLSVDKRKVVYYSIIGLAMVFQLYTQYEVVQMQKQEPVLNKPLVKDGQQQFHLQNGLLAYVITDNSQINNFVDSNNSFFDYYPNSIGQRGYLLSNDMGWYKDKKREKHIQFHKLGNGAFRFHAKKIIHHLSIPFIAYNGVKYKVFLDGKQIKYLMSDSQTILLNSVNAGNHHIKIIVQKSILLYGCYGLSLLGLLTSIYLFVRDRKRKVSSVFDYK